MMILLHRSIGVAPGKNMSAIGFAREIAAYVKKNYDRDMEVLAPVGGNPHRVAWLIRYKDLAEMEAASARLMQDKQYWELLNKNTDNFIAGSAMDAIWRTL